MNSCLQVYRVYDKLEEKLQSVFIESVQTFISHVESTLQGYSYNER
jgi:hypothetical protein